MPKRTTLHNQHLAVEKGTEIDQQASEEAGAPIVVETWTIVMSDRTYGDQFAITFRKDVRDAIVRDLTGGIVLAGGELPQAPPPESSG